MPGESQLSGPGSNTASGMATFILVHGAWHGAWCWRRIEPLLRARGHQVLAPDLPGHGDDPAAVGGQSLDDYAKRERLAVFDGSLPVGKLIGAGAAAEGSTAVGSVIRFPGGSLAR